MTRRIAIFPLGIACLLSGPIAAHAQGAFPLDGKQPDFPALTHRAVQLSLPLLQNSATTFTDKQKCISCHHQSLPAMAVALAHARGFKVNTKLASAQAERVYKTLAPAKELARAALTQPQAEKQLDFILVDPTAALGYAFAGLASGQWKKDESLEQMALYLAKKQANDGRWPVITSRPPLEGSEFTATALAMKALKDYGPQDHADELAQRIERGRDWLLAATPKSNEDKVFRLLGLRWAEAEPESLQKAVADLIADQHDDGGWGQLPNKASDAYATGQALVALNQAGGLPVSDSAYWRGRFFLLASQRADGSWLVKKRAIGVQPYFDSGFPNGTSQFISICGTAWATMALTLCADEGPTGPHAPPARAKSAAPKPIPAKTLNTKAK